MPTFAVLLRGINVGGHNVIKMKELRTSFSEWGYGDPVTYIQSGNVIVRSARGSNADTEAHIAEKLSERFDYDAKVLTRDLDELEQLVNAVPQEWELADKEMRFNAIFLDRGIKPTDFLKDVSIKPDIETVRTIGNAFLWCTSARDAPHSAMAKIPSHKMYKSTTIRNLNTTLKLFDIMCDYDER